MCANRKLAIDNFWKLIALFQNSRSDEPNRAPLKVSRKWFFPHPPRDTLRRASARLGGSFAMAKKAKKEKKAKKSKKYVSLIAPCRSLR